MTDKPTKKPTTTGKAVTPNDVKDTLLVVGIGLDDKEAKKVALALTKRLH